MRPGGGKAKGSGFEREVCTKLSLWISRGLRDDLLWRSAMSGGRASVKFKGGGRNTTQVGDISAIDPQGSRLTDRYVIECKFVKSLDLGAPLLAGRGNMVKFWEVLKDQSKNVRKHPILIARQNMMPPIVCLGVGALHLMRTSSEIESIAIFPRHDMWLYWFDDFLMNARRPT